MKKLDSYAFESIVKEAATDFSGLLKVVVKGFEVFATYKSNSEKIEQTTHLIFDNSGKFKVGYENPTANAPKFFVDKILNIVKEKTTK